MEEKGGKNIEKKKARGNAEGIGPREELISLIARTAQGKKKKLGKSSEKGIAGKGRVKKKENKTFESPLC